jgi:Methyltransferase domain
MKTRLDLLDSLPKHSIGAEIGVFAGDFSREILARVQPERLFLVDTFDGEVESGDVHGLNMRTLDMELQQEVLEKEFADRILRGQVSIERAISWDWLAAMPDSSLDWIYIDSSHTYRATARELEGAYHLVKNGGFICGHDYQAGYFPGVVQAVGEFCDRYFLTKELTTDDKLESFRIEVRK